MYAMAMMATEEKEETEDGVKEAHDVEARKSILLLLSLLLSLIILVLVLG